MTSSRDGARDAVPVVIGYTTLGLAAGMLLSASGLAWWWAPVWSLVIYSGTMQMLLVPLAAAGEPLAAITASAVFVSGRHVFYGLGFPLDRVRGGRLARLYAVHAITDEVYALLASKDRLAMSGRYILTVEALSHSAWITGTTAGALAGAGLASLVGERIELLGFVLTALFVVLAIENWRTHPDPTVLILGVCSGGVAIAVGGSAALLSGLGILAAGLVALYAWRRRESRGAAPPGASEPPQTSGPPGASGPPAGPADGRSATLEPADRPC
ncbi:MAG: AzlC family ABC transporter permease [Actinomyces sp.]|uniref:AzlC family ABC transporter permease n=1 Tax=Actinomyces sp. TaxID=29317 RepID=UPI0026DB68C5|nr:AzlC family ABC transporter permease [Actinomyces sp.]MDO4243834.1 AzlC family ABC transporter permease [Actinomyces sp.]